ncbi:GtrA family protein [Acinetobacter towneri]|uniref:GtrA family protein n=1 Tax=Acinetobacter towneri TaxID=202956 RepID=UPI00209851DA|nr:GtrA family protein [Acinetobacter towneri]MCO8059956.1 GtrA family protein [Acinetobacter towneri]MCO8065604.1 GtrA family protein [Acinetobacter towneri]
MKLVVYYSLFALVAIIANFCAQELSLMLYGAAYALWVSIVVGTLVGLVVKFYLDKTYVFKFITKNNAQQGYVFLLYSVMGVLTTSIFWGMEWAFYLYFSTDVMKYVGGFLGLVLGYIAKYYLDKHFVFRTD